MDQPVTQDDLFSLSELFDFATTPRTPEELRAFRRELAAMPRVGVYNALLVQIQRPGAHFVAPAHEWARLGRHIRPGANRLITLKPYGPVEFVYDVVDTDGAPLPERFVHPFAAEGEVTAAGLEWFLHRLPSIGVRCQRTAQGSLRAGQIQPTGTTTLRRGRSTVEVMGYTVSLNSRLDPTTAFAALAHELGHMFCGHFGITQDRRIRARGSLSRESQELEAESVAWIVTRRVGIATTSGEYLRDLVEGSELPPVDLERIAFAASKIEGLAGGAMPLVARLRGWEQAGAASSGAGAVGRGIQEFEDVPLFEL